MPGDLGENIGAHEVVVGLGFKAHRRAKTILLGLHDRHEGVAKFPGRHSSHQSKNTTARSKRATVSTCSVNGMRLNAASARRRSLPREVNRTVSLRKDSSPQLTYTKRSGGCSLRYSVSAGSRPLRGGSAITTSAPAAARHAAPAGPGNTDTLARCAESSSPNPSSSPCSDCRLTSFMRSSPDLGKTDSPMAPTPA